MSGVAMLPPLYLLVALLARSVQPLLLKAGGLAVDEFTVAAVLSNPYYWATLAVMIGQVWVWHGTLRHYALSFAYPFLSLSYVVILIAGYALFGEVVTPAKIAGVGIIVFGVILMSLDGEPHV